MKTDVVLINPGDRSQIYQSLGSETAAIEPPFWVAVLAAYLRLQGHSVAAIDANAEGLSSEETAQRVADLGGRLAVVVVYGSQPSASTQNMTVAGNICRALRSLTDARVAIGGLHPSALPERTLREEEVDFVVDGEGPLTLSPLVQLVKHGSTTYETVPGLWFREKGALRHTARAPLIRDLDTVLPAGAWDLLPMKLYRAHNWHCFDGLEHRQPYGVVYTSLGCPFHCSFCCINAPFEGSGIRFRSPRLVLDELETFVRDYDIRNVKIADELFVLKEAHYMAIVEGIIERGLDLNIWVYSRVDTMNPRHLDRMKRAGINWLALGIESASAHVRAGVDKQQRRDVREVVKAIKDSGIRVIGNFIFGLPDDTYATMRATLDLALALQCEFVNLYSAMAYPGSRLYADAVANNWALPDSWHAYSQHAYETRPLPTHALTAAQVLAFRDNAFREYFRDERYLAMIERAFGPTVRTHLERVTDIQLPRKLLEPGHPSMASTGR